MSGDPLPRGCDVAVVGAGAVGCAIAWRLAQEGLSVVLVERVRPGAEASSAAAGLLASQHESSGQGPFFQLLRRSEGLWRGFAEEIRDASSLDPGWRACGALEVAQGEREGQALAARLAWQRQAGLAVEWLDGREARSRLPALAPEIDAALWFPDAAQVDAQRLTASLWACAAAAGARLAVGEARRLLVEGGRVAGLLVDDRPIAAAAVVLAAGAFSALVEGVGLPPRAVRPVRGQIVCFDLRAPFAAAVFGTGGYLAPKPDGRLLVGSTMEEVGFDKSVTGGGVRGLLELAARLCPALREAPIGSLWAGLRPATADGLPALGPSPGIAGLHLALGHFRNGILLAPVTAEIVAAGVRGKPVDLAPELSAARLSG
ncbi:MAG: glycine oxidase ThiO [Myxococcales bacterium]